MMLQVFPFIPPFQLMYFQNPGSNVDSEIHWDHMSIWLFVDSGDFLGAQKAESLK